MRKKKMIALLIYGLIAALTVGYAAMAAGYGTEADPLVTLSYITNIFKPEVASAAASAAQAQVNAYSQTMQSGLSKLETAMASKLQDLERMVSSEAFIKQVAAESKTEAYRFELIHIPAGKTLQAETGTELLLRTGSAASVGTLVDVTSGASFSAGGALSANHLYLAAEAGGVRATSSAMAFVKGEYSISD